MMCGEIGMDTFRIWCVRGESQLSFFVGWRIVKKERKGGRGGGCRVTLGEEDGFSHRWLSDIRTTEEARGAPKPSFSSFPLLSFLPSAKEWRYNFQSNSRQMSIGIRKGERKEERVAGLVLEAAVPARWLLSHQRFHCREQFPSFRL